MIGQIWDLIALQPMINILISLTHYLFNSFGISIIALTIVVNICMYPLTMKQIHATQAMQSLQPKLAELQKKYAKDRQKLAQEQMKLYRESGMSPTGCLLPLFAQMPIWIALYQSIIRLLAVTPEGFLELSRFLYSWPLVYSVLPLEKEFLWLNMATPDTILAVIVAASMWVQQKMSTPATTDPKQMSQARMMQWMMPLMFGFFCLSFPSGLALFWATSTLIRIGMQYYSTGRKKSMKIAVPQMGIVDRKFRKRIAEVEAGNAADISVERGDAGIETEEGTEYGRTGDKRQDSGGGYSARFEAIRRQSGRGRSRRRKRR